MTIGVSSNALNVESSQTPNHTKGENATAPTVAQEWTVNDMRLGDLDALLDKFLRSYTEQEKVGNFQFVACEIKQNFADMVCEQPTIDVVPVVHGRWVNKGGYLVWCSECNNHNETKKTLYCPNCGAKMDGEGK